jgi:hypothetical protein
MGACDTGPAAQYYVKVFGQDLGNEWLYTPDCCVDERDVRFRRRPKGHIVHIPWRIERTCPLSVLGERCGNSSHPNDAGNHRQ